MSDLMEKANLAQPSDETGESSERSDRLGSRRKKQMAATSKRCKINGIVLCGARRLGRVHKHPSHRLHRTKRPSSIAEFGLIDDPANQFILTPGFTFHIPSGSEEVFQGRGDGEWNVFVSAAKGFDNLHLTGNIGARIPHDSDEQSTILHYSLMVDYYAHQYFIPFIAANAWTVLSEGNNVPFNSEGYDVINFGSSDAGGVTQMTVGAGFRSRLTQNIDLGLAYELAVLSPEGLTDDRFTFDVSIRF